jgi:ABC-type branched-subunit amino acid transport system ATPase component/ABC-type branched-subunit amino acid transport system permease subunit
VWEVGGVRITSNDIIMLVITAVAAGGFFLFLKQTRLGLSMKAVVDRPELAGLRGISDRQTSYAAWAIGAGFAGLAGVAGAPFFGPLTANRYTAFMLIAATAAVVARFRSVPIALAAGLALGMVKNYVARYAAFADQIQGLENAVPFIIMFASLLVLARDPARRGGVAVAIEAPVNHAEDLGPLRRRLPWMVATVVLVLAIGFVLDAFWLGTVAYGLALAVVFLSFVLVTGIGGMVSLAQATFVTMGGLIAGLLIERYRMPFLPALVVAALGAVLLGAVAALPSLRLGGLALALATLALALVGDAVLFQLNFLRHGQQGWAIAPPSLGPFDLGDPRTLAFTLLAVVLVGVWFIRAIERSSFGRAAFAVRDSEVAAASSGVSIPLAKLTIFCVSASFAGTGGVLLAMHQGNITNVTFPSELGLLWLAVTVLFGIRRPGAAVIGALVAAFTAVWFRSGWQLPSALPTFLDWGGAGDSWSDVSAMLFGLGAVQVARNTDGVTAVVGGLLRSLRDRRRDPSEPHVPFPEPAPAANVTDREPPSPSFESAALELVDLCAGYGPVSVLHRVDLALPAGSLTVLLGANGAGKTTLCQATAGLIPVTRGAVFSYGLDLTSLPAHQRARRGVLLAPESRGIFPSLSVEENLSVWLPARSDRAVVFERFPLLGKRRNVPAGNLSGGEQQILTLGALLQRPPKVLVVDEPSLGLAPKIFGQIKAVLRELSQAGVTILLVEERADRVLDIADRVSVLQLGRLAWSGVPGDLDDDMLAALYLSGDVLAAEGIR